MFQSIGCILAVHVASLADLLGVKCCTMHYPKRYPVDILLVQSQLQMAVVKMKCVCTLNLCQSVCSIAFSIYTTMNEN